MKSANLSHLGVVLFGSSPVLRGVFDRNRVVRETGDLDAVQVLAKNWTLNLQVGKIFMATIRSLEKWLPDDSFVTYLKGTVRSPRSHNPESVRIYYFVFKPCPERQIYVSTGTVSFRPTYLVDLSQVAKLLLKAMSPGIMLSPAPIDSNAPLPR
jgi:hypothetical protein